MTVDEFSKLILSLAAAGGMIAVSIGLFKVLMSAGSNLDDLRRTTQNMGKITDNLIEEQKHLDVVLNNVESISSDIKDMLGFVGKINSYVKKFKK